MTSPNFDALERIAAAHHFLTMHPELPAFRSFNYSRESGRIGFTLSTPAEVDAYGEALRLPVGQFSDPSSVGFRSFMRWSDSFSVVAYLSGPLAAPDVETAADTAAVSHG